MQSDACLELALLAITGVSPSAGRWVQLHVADPGVDGLRGRARNATRKPVSFAVSGGDAVSLVPVVWGPLEVVAEERYSHLSVWSSAAGGDFLWSLVLAGSRVSPGDEYIIQAGQIVVGFD